MEQGIDSHLEAIQFFQDRGEYGRMKFDVTANTLPVLVRRLLESGSDSAVTLASDICCNSRHRANMTPPFVFVALFCFMALWLISKWDRPVNLYQPNRTVIRQEIIRHRLLVLCLVVLVIATCL